MQKKGEEGEEVRPTDCQVFPGMNLPKKHFYKSSPETLYINSKLSHAKIDLITNERNSKFNLDQKFVAINKDFLELDNIPPASPREKKKVKFNLVPMIKTTTEDHPTTTTTRVVRKIVRKVQVRRVRQSTDLASDKMGLMS